MKATLHACSALHQTIGCIKQTAMDSRAPNHTEPRWDATLSTGLDKGMQKRPKRQPRWVIQGSIMIRTSPINSNHGSKAGSHHVLPFQNGMVWKSKKKTVVYHNFLRFYPLNCTSGLVSPVFRPQLLGLVTYTESPAHPHLHVGRIARHLATKFRMCLSSDSGELDAFHRNFTWVSRIYILALFTSLPWVSKKWDLSDLSIHSLAIIWLTLENCTHLRRKCWVQKGQCHLGMYCSWIGFIPSTCLYNHV